jgi:hypothetical protein
VANAGRLNTVASPGCRIVRLVLGKLRRGARSTLAVDGIVERKASFVELESTPNVIPVSVEPPMRVEMQVEKEEIHEVRRGSRPNVTSGYAKTGLLPSSSSGSLKAYSVRGRHGRDD